MGRELHSEWRNSGLVGIDGWCRTEFAPAFTVSKNVCLMDDFIDRHILTTTTAQGWTVSEITAVDAGTLVSGTTIGGWINLTGTTNDGAGIQMQHCSLSWLPTTSKDIWFECRVQIATANDCDWMAGLAEADTNIFDTDPTELIVFRGDDGDANIDFQVRNGGAGASADTGADTANATAVVLGFHVKDATTVTPYINGTAYTAVTTNIPALPMAVTFGMAGGAADSNTFGVDWFRILQLR